MWRAANVRETPIETRERMADIRLVAAEAMMDFFISVPSKGIIETLRERLAELEHLEASGTSTPDTHEELVDIHEFLGRFYTMSLAHASKTLH
jgi:hypothetical protein